MNAHPQDMPAPESLPPLPEAVQARVDHLFRGARRAGLIHPLQPLVQRHRAEMLNAPAAVPGPRHE